MIARGLCLTTTHQSAQLAGRHHTQPLQRLHIVQSTCQAIPSAMAAPYLTNRSLLDQMMPVEAPRTMPI